jgi:hypothetical protein
MRRLGISPERIVAWLGTYDYPLLVATGIRCMLEEFPASMHLMFQDPSRRSTETNSGKEFVPLCDLANSLVSAVPCQLSEWRTTTITHGSHIWSHRSPEIRNR